MTTIFDQAAELAKQWRNSEYYEEGLIAGRMVELLEKIAALGDGHGLTDEQIQKAWDEACNDSPSRPGWARHLRLGRSIESAATLPLKARILELEQEAEYLKNRALDWQEQYYEAIENRS